MFDTLNTIFISHGGGPLPLLGDIKHREMVEMLQTISSSELRKPDAIIVVSAHWEESIPTITSNARPQLIYDYYGFPEESYHIKYPAIGEPKLAGLVHDCLTKAGIHSKLDDQRGFDHGLFVPLKIMYPHADIPCIQLSLVNNLDPKAHIELGKALSDIAYPNLLMIGSGFSFHNLPAFFKGNTMESKKHNDAFQKWLNDTMTDNVTDESIRENGLINWSQAPFARYCHPREEHLLPLHVCYGIHQSSSKKSFSLQIMDNTSSMFLW